MFKSLKIDWYIVGSLIPILTISLITMNSFTGEGNYAERQFIWICVAFFIFFVSSFIDFRFLRRTSVIVSLYSAAIVALFVLFAVGHVSKGAKNWISLGLFSIQPSDPIKLVLILLLAKYFSRRHVQIAHIRHIIVSGIYVAIVFVLVALQPDFGSSIVIFSIWLGDRKSVV